MQAKGPWNRHASIVGIGYRFPLNGHNLALVACMWCQVQKLRLEL